LCAPWEVEGPIPPPTLVHGIWEAKDSDDDLTKEVCLKFKKGYPLINILFQSPAICAT
jgi:hypothetical protein